MKKKLLSIFAIILCCSFVLVGCGVNGTSWTKYIKGMKEAKLTSAKEYTITEGLTFVDTDADNNVIEHFTNSGLAYVKNSENKYGVWSLVDNKLIVECTHDDMGDITFIGGLYSYVRVYTAETAEVKAFYTIYDRAGNVVLDRVEAPVIPTFNMMILGVNGKTQYEYWTYRPLDADKTVAAYVKVTGYGEKERKVYTNEEVKGTKLGVEKESAYSLEANNQVENLDYLYSQELNTNGNKEYTFYKLDGKKTGTLVINPSLTDDLYFVGNYIYYQEVVVLPDDANNYDVFAAGTKANITTYAFNIANGKTNKLNVKEPITARYAIAAESDKSLYYIRTIKVEQHIALMTSYNYYLALDGQLAKAEHRYNSIAKYGNYYLATYPDATIPVPKTYAVVLDKSGKEISKLLADYFRPSAVADNAIVVMDNRAGSETRNKYALVDFKGNMITAFEYDYIGEFESGYAIAVKSVESENAEHEHVTTETFYRINNKGETTAVSAREQVEGSTSWTYKIGDTVVENVDFDATTVGGYKITTKADDKYTITVYNNAGTQLIQATNLDAVKPLREKLVTVDAEHSKLFLELAGTIYTVEGQY